MPRASKKLKRQHQGYRHAHFFDLLTGHSFFTGQGFNADAGPGASHEAIENLMRKAWTDPDVRQRTYDLLEERHSQGRSLDRDVPAAVAMFGNE